MEIRSGSPARTLLIVGLLSICSTLASAQILPVPSADIPRAPRLAPMVITPGGQRLMLSESGVEVSYNPATQKLVSNRPGWWIVNFPLERVKNYDGPIAGLSQLLFDVPQEYVWNWYLKTPGTATPEPAAPTGPAIIEPTPNPTLVVNQRAENASDSNPGTLEAPLATISAAAKRATAGTIIHVYYGIYRENVLIEASGTPEEPIRLEGIRGPEGMPIIEGNDPFPANAWSPTIWPGVFRADLFTNFEGPVTLDSAPLIERSLPSELGPGEYASNRASREFLQFNVDPKSRPKEGDTFADRTWRRVGLDNDGFLNMNGLDFDAARNAIYWVTTNVWIQPKNPATFDPAKAASIPGDLLIDGEFRSYRSTGTRINDQSNKNRIWVNGELLPAMVYSTAAKNEIFLPHPHRNAGVFEEWFHFPFKEGWNQLMFQLDTTIRPDATRMRFRFPEGVTARTSADPPAAMNAPNDQPALGRIAQYMVLGPFPTTPDRGVYVRLPNNQNPNERSLELAARTTDLLGIVTAKGHHTAIRGFVVRNGTQYQQRPMVALEGFGNLLEGSVMSGIETVGVTCNANGDINTPVTIIRNNWIYNPGNVGFGCSGISDLLTPDTVDGSTPGRSSAIFEHNYVTGNNWGGFSLGWSAGSSKSFKVSGLVFRYNTLEGGSGPGIWLDFETWNNRVEGNMFRDVYRYAVGVEASPGPNLVANNIVAGIRPDTTIYNAALLSWDSTRSWAINNTVDGRNNAGKGWRNIIMAGIDLGEGGTRDIRFGPLKSPRQVYDNNIIVGFDRATAARSTDEARANFTENGTGATIFGKAPEFRNLAREDYRLMPASTLNRSGVLTPTSIRVTHDFNGLLRQPAILPLAVGAFRVEPSPVSATENMMEIEYTDGVQRMINGRAPAAADELDPAAPNAGSPNNGTAERVKPSPLAKTTRQTAKKSSARQSFLKD